MSRSPAAGAGRRAYRNAAQPGGPGIVVIGGYVYRGDDVPQLRGRYIFGDFSTGFAPPDGLVFMAKPANGNRMWHIQELSFPDRGGRLGEYVLGFGQDADGEVYVLTSGTTGPAGDTGKVYRLTRPGSR